MSKEKNEDAAALKFELRRVALRSMIEKFFVDNDLSNHDALALLTPVLYDIFKSIAKTEKLTEEHVWGTFVKTFGVWEYPEMKKEGRVWRRERFSFCTVI